MKRRNFIKITFPIMASPSLLATGTEADKPEVSFGVIADPQYADADVRGNRHYRNSLKKLTSAMEELNKHELDFTVTLGDVIDRDLKSFDAIMPLYRKANMPLNFVFGNHDFDVAGEDKEKVLNSAGLEESYYVETYDHWHFIYLDGTDVSTYRYKKNDPRTKTAQRTLEKVRQQERPQAQSWNGAISEQQLKWLNAQLEVAKKSKKRVIIFNHFPVIPLNDPHNLWNDEELVSLIEKFPNVIAYMNGHNHKGNYAVHKGCHFINFKGMVEGKTETPFAIVKCYADRVEIDGFGNEPDRKI